jgi:Flp pilus assembly protein TadG
MAKRSRRVVRTEDGQVLPLLALGLLLLLLGIAALVVDVGRAYVVKRQLQSAADAAALAGAQALPNVANARALASSFGTGGRNPLPYPVTEAPPAVVCLKGVYCAKGGANGVQIVETADVPTTFAKIFGLDHITVHVRSTACGPCAAKPLDIAVVVDRTGSMAGNVQDLQSGVQTFLRMLNPQLDRVALLVLPPGDPCRSPGDDPYGSSDYLAAPLSDDYLRDDGSLNPGSAVVRAVNCLRAGGPTTYRDALQAAQGELVAHGRPGVQRVIVFETDGAANAAPDSAYLPPLDALVAQGLRVGSPLDNGEIQRPCGSAVDYARSIRPSSWQDPTSGTIVFTVGYAVQQDDGCFVAPYVKCRPSTKAGCVLRYKEQSEGGLQATDALTQMATDPKFAVQQSQETDMSKTFAFVASQLNGRLVPDDWASP